MPEQDALRGFDFSSFGNGGLFLKFEAGKAVTLRVLTVDPMVQQTEYETDGETTFSTKFYFIVYNFTDGKAQILGASPGVARKIGELHTDEDFGANIRKIDIKITPSGEKLTRKYDVQVLPKARELSNAQIKEAQEIDLEKAITDGQRMSYYDPDKPPTKSGIDQARETAKALRADDPVIDDIDEEPINLDDIPF